MNNEKTNFFKYQLQLRCIYNLLELIEKPIKNSESFFIDVVNIIQTAFIDNKKISVSMTINDKQYFSEHFILNDDLITKNIYMKNKKIGVINFYFLHKTKADYLLSNGYLDFIQHIVGFITKVLEFKYLETELKSANYKIAEYKEKFERKSIALNEVLEHIGNQKNTETELIKTNIEIILLPLIEKMRINNEPDKNINLIISSLKELTSGYGPKLKNELVSLSPREIEICHLLKNGFSSKEIANYLSISTQTVNKHRFFIRKKIGLVGRKINLVNYLKKTD